MKIHTDFQQGSLDWHEIRKGRFGGGTAGLFCVDGKNDGMGSGLVSAMYEKLAQRLYDEDYSIYINDAMQRGMDLEPIAREMYESQTFSDVQQVGYISEGEWLGVSPDGLVGNDGMIEIKCPMGKEFIRYSIERTVKKEYLAQMQWGMWISGRAWCDFVVFHPDAGIIVKRFERDEEAMNLFAGKVPKVINRMKGIIAKSSAHLVAQ